jgi:hypothetical protein
MNIALILAELKAERGPTGSCHYCTGTRRRAAAIASHVPVPSGRLSVKGLARIRAAQRARWAKVRVEKKVAPIQRVKVGKRTMSASARRKIGAAAQRARWAKLK